MTKDEALHKALKVLNCLNNDRVYETAWVKGAINACEEALEPQPKEKKYLYVYHENGAPLTIISYRFANHTGYEYLGKIEVQNDQTN